MQEPCIAKLADQLFMSTASIRRIIMFLNESFQKRGFLLESTLLHMYIFKVRRDKYVFLLQFIRGDLYTGSTSSLPNIVCSYQTIHETLSSIKQTICPQTAVLIYYF